jgi:hypothetical protein
LRGKFLILVSAINNCLFASHLTRLFLASHLVSERSINISPWHERDDAQNIEREFRHFDPSLLAKTSESLHTVRVGLVKLVTASTH